MKLQRHVIAAGQRVVVVFEGRDAAGKDGTIKRVVEHMSPRETRVVALGPPSDRDRSSWYYQRYVGYLPAAEEIVLFNRSWYNRAGVERVMGFCTESEYAEFIDTVGAFERLLVQNGIVLIKYYLDITRDEQAERMAERRNDPLKQWKVSPVDAKALAKWDEYSKARDAMLAATHSAFAPWTVVRADDKRETRINVIRDLLQRLPYEDGDTPPLPPDPDIVVPYDRIARGEAGLAP